MAEIETSHKRRRVERTPSPKLDEDDAYEPYVPVAQRRNAKLAKLAARGGADSERERARKEQQERDEREDALREEETLREKARRERTLLQEAQEVHSKKAAEGMSLSYSVDSLRNPI
jgi:ATP-dependent RNA helicase DDX41